MSRSDIDVTITGDTSDLQKKLAELKKQMADLRTGTASNSVDVANKALKQAETSAAKASEVLAKAKENVQKQKDLLVQAEKELADVQKKLESIQNRANARNNNNGYLAVNDKGLRKAVQNVRQQEAALSKAQDTLDKAKINAGKADNALKSATDKVQRQKDTLAQATKELSEAQKALAKAQSQAKARSIDGTYVAKNSKAVQEATRAVQEQYKALDDAQKKYKKAQDAELQARHKSQTEIYKETIAANTLEKAKLAEAQANEKLQKKQASRDKLQSKVGQSSNGTVSAKDSTALARAEREYAKAQLEAELAIKRRQIAEQQLQKAQERREKAQRALVKATNNTQTAGEMANTIIPSRVNRATDNFKAVNQKAVQQMSADEIKSAEEAIKKAESRMNRAQKAVEKAALAEKSAAQALKSAQHNVSTAESKVGTAQSNVSSARSGVSTANTEAKTKISNDEVKAAQQVVDNAQKKLEAAQKAVQKAVDAEAKATNSLNSAQNRENTAKMRVDTAEARQKITQLRGQMQNLKQQSQLNLTANTQSAQGRLAKALDIVQRLKGPHTVSLKSDSVDNLIHKLALVSAAFYGIKGVMNAISETFNTLVGSGLEYQKQMENARIGIAGIYASMTEIDGKRTTFEQGLGIANEVVEKLNRVAAITAATPTDMITTFQGLAAPGLGAGMSTDELVKFTTAGVNAAKAMQLPSTQFIQELRDLVQGGIQPASSTIATALGLKDADIAKMKASADGLFKSLMEKMQGMSEGANAYTETIMGKQELLKQAFIQASAAFTSSFEVEIKAGLDATTSLFADVDTQAGTFEINPEILDTIEQLKLDLYEVMDMFGSFDVDTGAWTPSDEAISAWEDITSLLEQLRDFALDISDMIVDWTPAIGAFVDGLTDGLSVVIDILDSMVNVVDNIGEAVGKSDTLLGLIKDIAEIIVLVKATTKAYYITLGLIAGVLKVIKAVTTTIKIIEQGITKLKLAQVALNMALQAGAAGLAVLAVGGVALLGGALDGVFSTISEKMDGLFGRTDSEEASYQKELAEIGKKRKDEYGQNTKTDEYAYTHAKNRNQEKVDEKTEAARLKAVQKGLSQLLKRIDNALKDQLQLQKEHMEKVELLNKQSKISMDAYYAEKAQNDKVVAEANLNALKQKKEAILNVEWPDDKLEERDSKLEQINAEMAKQTRALQLAAESISSLKELKGIVEQGFIRDNATRSEADIVNSKTATAIQQELTKFAQENGWDDPKGTIQQVMESARNNGVDARQLVAQIQQESHGQRNAQSSAGAVGLGQLMPSTAAGMGIDPYDWRQNIEGTARYIAQMMQTFNGNVEQAVAAYNAGPNGNFNNSETQAYVRKVMEVLQQFASIPDSRYLQPASSVYGFNADNAHRLEGSNFDSRYASKWESAPGRTNLNGVQNIVSQTFNQMAAEFQEKTGKSLLITGASESGHASGTYSHGNGWKLDLEPIGDNLQTLIDIANRIGVAIGNEGDHLDLSFGGGGVGGTLLTNNATGSLHNVQTPQNYTATNSLALEYLEQVKKFNEELMQGAQSVAELYGEGAAEKIKIVNEKYAKQMAEVTTQYPDKMGEERVAQLKILWDSEVRNIRFDEADSKLKFALKDLEASSSVMGGELVDGVIDLQEALDKYYDHFNGDDSPIKQYVADLEKLMREYENQGNLEMYWKVRSEIENVKKSLNDIVSSWLSQIDDALSWQGDMVNANWTLSNGQKERINNDLDILKHQAKADAAYKNLEETAQKLKENLEELQKVAAELETTTDEVAKKSLLDRQTHIQDTIKQLQQEQNATARTYELETRLAHVKTLLEETRETAKNALEDGLVEFLIDGIQEAENLGEALRNLAYNFLKTMNEFFAKKVVANFMDAVFPGENVTGEEAELDESGILSASLDKATTATEQSTTMTEQAVTTLETNTEAINNLTNAVSNAKTTDEESSVGTTQTEGDTTASTGTATPTSGSSSKASASAQSVDSNFITSAFGSSFGQLAGSLFAVSSLVGGDRKEQLLSMIYLQLQLIFQRVSAISFAASSTTSGFATGGYITGAGTGTSDSIPAMLSNGEYVVKADSVRQYGRTMLDRINSGSYERLRVSVPKFATGGYVGSTGAKATDSFATSFGASVSPQLHVNNYVDGKKVFDAYGRDVVRSEVTKSIIQNAKLYSKTLGRV